MAQYREEKTSGSRAAVTVSSRKSALKRGPEIDILDRLSRG